LDELRKIVNAKLAQNHAARVEALALIESHEAIAFVGAGLSVPLGYPGWPELLTDMENEGQKLKTFVIPADLNGSYLDRAEVIKQHFVRLDRVTYYEEMLGRTFAPFTDKPNYTNTHKLLAGLPFRGFATTNYEDAIECALQVLSPGLCPDHGIVINAVEADRHRVSLFLQSITGGTGPTRFVAHLHGRHNVTKSIILTTGEYENAYGFPVATAQGTTPERATFHRYLTWALFATRRMVFVGCSMKDPYIKALLNAVSRDLWQSFAPNHFAVLPLEAADLESAESVAADFARYGVRVVYYDNLDGNHTGLDRFLEEAAARCERRAAPGTATKAAVAPAANPPSAPTGDSDSAAWLEEINERIATKPEQP
jgi:hypothetical protein